MDLKSLLALLKAIQEHSFHGQLDDVRCRDRHLVQQYCLQPAIERLERATESHAGFRECLRAYFNDDERSA